MVCKEKSFKKTLPHTVSLKSFERFHDVQLFVIKGKINGYKATILVDDGCTHNFVSKEFSKGENLKTQDAPYLYEVEWASGNGMQVWEEFGTKLTITI